MKIHEELGNGIGEKCFPYGDGIIMKTGCKKPVCNLEMIINSESIGFEENYSENIKEIGTFPEVELSSEEIDKAQDLRIFYENAINCIQNPQHVVKECMKPEDPYDEEMAELKYMYSKPAAFIIIGKPSPDNMKFGKKLAEYWDCLYIDPITCFDVEPSETDSPALIWCRKYLSEGKCIPNEMVMRVMEQRAFSDEAMHRGFVLCGLPFAQQNGEPSAQEQMHMIFSWPFEPKIFVYITCPDSDVITKNQQMCYDTETGNFINKNVFSSHKEVLLMYSHEPRISTINSVTEDVFKEIEQEKKLVSENNVKHLVVIPEPNIRYILPRYKQAVLPPVELYIAQVHPQYVIRVDGRTTPTHMLKVVKARLEALPLQPVYLPLAMFKPKKQQIKEQKKRSETADPQNELEEEEEEDVMEEDDEFPFEFENLDEAYQELSNKDVTGIRFKWHKSNWKYLCPVSLREGKFVEGEAKYSARFLNKIYFLSSPEALNEFLKNPRLYLLPPNPQPTCKFIVIGHEYAGKSSVASYLAHAFQGKVINFPSLIQEEEKKKSRIKLRIAQENDIKAKMNELYQEGQIQYEAAEAQRKTDIQIWQKNQLDAIENRNIPEYNEDVEVLEDMFPMNEEATSPPIDFSVPLIPQLSFARCRWLKTHPDELLRYLPDTLRFPTPLPRTVTEDDLSNMEYDATSGKSTTSEEKITSSQEIGEILLSKIKHLESQKQNEILNGGWVIDDMTLELEVWQHLSNEEIIPLVVISLQDHSPEYSFLKGKKIAQLREISLQLQGNKEEEEKKDDEGEGKEEIDEEEEYEEEKEEKSENVLPAEIGLDSEEVIKYGEKLAEYDEKWSSIQESITSIHPPINVDVANKELLKVMVEVSQRIQALYHVPAEPFTDEDRAEERNTNANFEEIEGEEEEDEANEDILKNRRMGETNIFCPVAYQPNHVLWKGKEDLLAKYKGKVYTFSCEEAMEKFMDKPWEYVRRHNPEKLFPPLRICIVGPVGSGKTELGKLLSRTFGLIHKDFPHEINHTLIPKCKPLGRKVQYLEGKYIKDDSKDKELEGENSDEQSEINESENERNAAEKENKNLRASIKTYLLDGTPMPEIMIQKILTPLWAREKFQCSGFVLSGFPWHPNDIDVMKANNLIPDVIVSLSIQNEDIAKERLIKEMKEFHENEMEKRKRRAAKERAKLEAALAAADGVYGSPSLNLEIKNIILSHLEKSLPIDEDISEETEGKEKEGDEEEEEDMVMQYEEEILEWFANDTEKLEELKTLAEESNIDWLDMRGDNEMQDVCLRVVHDVYPLSLRSASTLEKTFPITLEEADQLLKSGYYFLSRFGRWCPVQLADGEIPVQLFTPMNQKAQIFPVIFRRFIYFLGGQENLELFQNDPLKYVLSNQTMPSIPVKIAVIGPPKSGKSTLASRLSKELNIKVITIGQAIRYVLQDLSWTELAIAIEDILKQGEIVPVKMALRCVEAATMDPRSATQGYVLDGFPVSNEQITELVSLNLFPYLIISLECRLLTCQTRLQSQVASFFSRTPVFSFKLLQYKYSNWFPISIDVKRKLNNEYDNVVTLDADHVVWWLFDKTSEQLFSEMKCIVQYYSDIIAGKTGKLECMCVSPDEFKDRQSKYLQYCPGCLQQGVLRGGWIPADKKGLVQYKEHYYWLCEVHLPEFLGNPAHFLPPKNEAELPENLPYIPTDDEDFEIANDGYCIVTYTESIPERLLVKGSQEYAVIYRKKKYLFTDATQRNKFLSDPVHYSAQKICMLPLRMPALNVQRFPTLGFLEQTVSDHIYTGLLGVTEERPKYPGVPLDLSASMYLGYNFKLINPQTSCTQMEILLLAQKEFLNRCEILRKLCQKTKIRNPLLTYPELEEKDEKAKSKLDDECD